jgi:hypothetical protein
MPAPRSRPEERRGPRHSQRGRAGCVHARDRGPSPRSRGDGGTRLGAGPCHRDRADRRTGPPPGEASAEEFDHAVGCIPWRRVLHACRMPAVLLQTPRKGTRPGAHDALLTRSAAGLAGATRSKADHSARSSARRSTG